MRSRQRVALKCMCDESAFRQEVEQRQKLKAGSEKYVMGVLGTHQYGDQSWGKVNLEQVDTRLRLSGDNPKALR